MSSNKLKESKILIENNSFDALTNFLVAEYKSSNIFVLADENTSKYCLPILAKALLNQQGFELIEIDSGEQNKTIESCIAIWNQLSKAGADKYSLLINLGGGVVTDIGGFIASTYLRGIDFINIPTSLMGMVDAAIGGKNGVDLNAIKNQIGTINFPEMIFIYPLFLNTLNDRHFKNGLAEIFKHGLIADKKLWLNLSSMEINRDVVDVVLANAIEVKNNIVKEDPYEKGRRKILNFGHTLGHVLESCYLNTDDEILHGEAIAAGMIMETWLSEMQNGLSKEDTDKITNKLFSLFGKHDFEKLNFIDILKYLRHDKKNHDNQIIFSLLKSIGNCSWDIPVSLSDIEVVFNRYKSFSL